MDNELTDYEQMIENVAKLAKVMRVYFEALIESGFSETQALLLTLEYQKSVTTIPKSQ